MEQIILVQVRFTEGDFTDALYFTEEEWATLPDWKSLAQKRIDNWNVIVPIGLTPEEELAQKQANVDSLKAQLAEAEAALVQ